MRGLGFFGLVASITLGSSVVAACGGSAANNPSATGGRNTGGLSTSAARGNDCGGMQNVSLSYDFARSYGTLNDEYVRYTDCTRTDYCKGMLQLTLSQ